MHYRYESVNEANQQ